jgi:hypothetical protein
MATPRTRRRSPSPRRRASSTRPVSAATTTRGKHRAILMGLKVKGSTLTPNDLIVRNGRVVSKAKSKAAMTNRALTPWARYLKKHRFTGPGSFKKNAQLMKKLAAQRRAGSPSRSSYRCSSGMDLY